jgi:hypothetical protein
MASASRSIPISPQCGDSSPSPIFRLLEIQTCLEDLRDDITKAARVCDFLTEVDGERSRDWSPEGDWTDTRLSILIDAITVQIIELDKDCSRASEAVVRAIEASEVAS